MGVKACQVAEQGLSMVLAADDCCVGIAPVEHVVLSVGHGIGGADSDLPRGSRTLHDENKGSDETGEPILTPRRGTVAHAGQPFAEQHEKACYPLLTLFLALQPRDN